MNTDLKTASEFLKNTRVLLLVKNKKALPPGASWSRPALCRVCLRLWPHGKNQVLVLVAPVLDSQYCC
jgi:hypothetical protein